MLPAHLSPECSSCTALCCSAYHFARDAGFPLDKQADRRCAFVRADHRCSIHAQRAARGFEACIAYDCYGAGQWITRMRLEDGLSETLERFRLVRSIHELLAMISLASRRISIDSDRDELEALADKLARLREEPLRELRAQLAVERSNALRVLRTALADHPSGGARLSHPAPTM